MGISAAVNNGRLPRNRIVSMWLSAKFDDAIPCNDGVYIAGIIFNTRGVVAVYVGGCERFALPVDVISAWVREHELNTSP